MVAAVKMAMEVLGVMQVAEEWGEVLTGEVFVDSTAALGIVKRKVCGNMRHVKVG